MVSVGTEPFAFWRIPKCPFTLHTRRDKIFGKRCVNACVRLHDTDNLVFISIQRALIGVAAVREIFGMECICVGGSGALRSL